MIDVWEGSVSGTVAYACRKRRPRAASALNAGVSIPDASGPMESARVVSSVTRRVEGCGDEAGPVSPLPPRHALMKRIATNTPGTMPFVFIDRNYMIR